MIVFTTTQDIVLPVLILDIILLGCKIVLHENNTNIKLMGMGLISVVPDPFPSVHVLERVSQQCNWSSATTSRIV
jgi:hypothetical protein